MTLTMVLLAVLANGVTVKRYATERECQIIQDAQTRAKLFDMPIKVVSKHSDEVTTLVSVTCHPREVPIG